MYSTKDEILGYMSEDELVRLSSDSGDAIDDTKVDKAIANADAEIDPYCIKFYSLPFNPVPDRIKTLSAEIAVYNLYKNRIIVTGGAIPEGITKMYDAAIAFLKTVASGSTKIPGATEKTQSTSATSSAGGFAQNSDSIFNKSNW